ncbi:hypothetical protein SAMN05192581_10624 [Bacteroides ovatus]|jgi:hypothetical protein|uniref:DUF6562 domain-containing protein n=1 Tax=Bacteroides ovatus TaxID=28116 RepID=A0A1G6GAX2_BACOV|nr:DUF6562 domain-containing protein [Bacteroides ovatus]SDB79124.1 hypothetical protein SAMN05192581_10624 [Bacteroides ovatus]
MIQIIKKAAFGLACITAFLLTSCDKTAHEIPEDAPDNGSTVTVGINTDAIGDTPLKDVHLYFFDSSEMLAKHTYYPTMQSLALDRMLMETGYYTIFAVLNTKESCVPTVNRAADLPKITFGEFCQWVKSIDNGTYPNLVTGLVRYEVKEGVSQIMIDVKKGSEAVGFSTVTLNLTFPSPRLPDFVAAQKNSRAAGDELKLRAVIEVYNKGTDTRVLRKEEFVTATATEGIYTSTLQLTPGNYDVRLWADYTTDSRTDNHYITTDTKSIKILGKDQYRGNTDTRDAFTKAFGLTVRNSDQSETITMYRPLAKYRLVANDVAKYNQLRAECKYPALEDLKISIVYEGFLPCAYNVSTQRPSDSDGGYGYASALSQQSDEAVTVGKDFILVNGEQSFVTVTILFKDASGKTISGINGVRIDYHAGQLTTVTGNFFTAGVGGVRIDTNWSGDYEVNF